MTIETTPLDSADDPVRIAIVGLGYWGPNLLRNLHDLPEAAVACLCDLDETALSTLARRYPSIRTTTRYTSVLADSAIEAVAIATPISTHYELALAALHAGKHVLVEKPLAQSSAEGLDLMSRAAAQGRVLMPGHTFLYSPPVNAIRDLITSGELGDIYFISTSRVNLGLHQPDVSVLWDLGPHDFSILRYWLDELPARVMGVSRGCIVAETPDVAFITLEFPSGAIANVELSWLAPSKLRRTTIVGSRKMIVYDDTSTEPVRVFDSGVVLPNPDTFGEYRLAYRTGEIVSPPVPATEPLSLELIDFCRAVRTGARPVCTPEIGVDVIRVIEAVESSLRRPRGWVEIETATAASAF